MYWMDNGIRLKEDPSLRDPHHHSRVMTESEAVQTADVVGCAAAAGAAT